MTTKQKRINKSKEQLLEEAKQKEEVLKLRKIVKEEIYPLLLEKSKSIDDAKVFCNTVSVAIKQSFNNRMRELKVAELGLKGMLAQSQEKERYEKMFDILNSHTIMNALKMIDDLPTAIDGFIREEMCSRPLNGLKAELL